MRVDSLSNPPLLFILKRSQAELAKTPEDSSRPKQPPRKEFLVGAELLRGPRYQTAIANSMRDSKGDPCS